MRCVYRDFSLTFNVAYSLEKYSYIGDKIRRKENILKEMKGFRDEYRQIDFLNLFTIENPRDEKL